MSYIGLPDAKTNRVTYSYTATTGQTTFTALYNVGFVDVFLNGVKLVSGVDFTATSGGSIVMTTGVQNGDNVEIISYKTVSLPDVYTQAQSDVRFLQTSMNQQKNYIINGNFDIWQRGTSTTALGYLADRWTNENVGTTKTYSRQAFTIGQTDVPNNPTYFSRTVVTSVAGASNYAIHYQKIENVANSSNKTFTLSFWAKADASKNMVIEFFQEFGSGGSPSASTIGLNITTCALTTAWQKFSITTSYPSVSGKILGTDNNSWFGFLFWFDAGSSHDSRTNSLGQQSGTFDIAQVQLEEGNVATQFEFRHSQQELALCQRYYEKSYDLNTAPGTATVNGNRIVFWDGTSNVTHTVVFDLPFRVEKRAVPVMTYYSPTNGATGNFYEAALAVNVAIGTELVSTNHAWCYGTTGTASTVVNARVHWTADAEI